LSKRHGAKRKHRKKTAKHSKAILCASCRKPADDPWSLLAGIASALNAAADAGVKVKLKPWAVLTSRGYVLNLSDGRWGPRTADYTTYPEAAEADPDSELED
jgi:hypothetical protein